MTNNFFTRNTTNLGFAVLLLVVLGCSCPQKLSEFTKKSEPSTPSPSNTATVPDKPTTPTPTTPTTPKGDYDLTMAKYSQLSIGMPRSKVESILGGPGTEISSSKGGGVSFSVNKWQGANYKAVILSFKADKIMSKSQVGLDK